jgi:hypothetical protein
MSNHGGDDARHKSTTEALAHGRLTNRKTELKKKKRIVNKQKRKKSKIDFPSFWLIELTPGWSCLS